MKRILLTVAAGAVLAAGGAATAYAAQEGDDRDERRDGRAAAARLADVKITADRAAAAALQAVPGRIESLELDDDDADRLVWEADVLADGGSWRGVLVDASTGKVTADRQAAQDRKDADDADDADDRNDDRGDDADDARDDDQGDDTDDRNERAAEANGLQGAKVTAEQAARTALGSAAGTVTSIEFEDGRFWQVDVIGTDGRERELHVDAATGKITSNTADDDRDDD
ncbi:PepSY domain-containing protein [Actinomadura viridis]|uniref:PepSY domain-containing protein n=1 Tax=Actinomadura viridis TaxID=58110 RepID=UPI0036746640